MSAAPEERGSVSAERQRPPLAQNNAPDDVRGANNWRLRPITLIRALFLVGLIICFVAVLINFNSLFSRLTEPEEITPTIEAALDSPQTTPTLLPESVGVDLPPGLRSAVSIDLPDEPPVVVGPVVVTQADFDAVHTELLASIESVTGSLGSAQERLAALETRAEEKAAAIAEPETDPLGDMQLQLEKIREAVDGIASRVRSNTRFVKSFERLALSAAALPFTVEGIDLWGARPSLVINHHGQSKIPK